MANLGFNSNLQIDKKKLHIQTGLSQEQRRISVSVFEGGTLVDKREFPLDPLTPEDHLEQEVRQYHDFVLTDLEMLFFVARQVRISKSLPAIKKMGQLFLKKGFLNEAIEFFEIMQKGDPLGWDCQYEIGQAFFQKGEYDEAVRYLLEALKAKPSYPDYHGYLAKIYWKLGQYGDAIKSFRKAVEFNPAYHQAYYQHALLLIESAIENPQHIDLPPPIERIRHAVQLLRKTASLSDSYNERMLISGIEKLDDREDLPAALLDLEQAYQPPLHLEFAQMMDAEFYLKFMFASMDKDNRELRHYIQILEKAVALHGDFADLHQSLSLAYLIRGWQYFSKAIEELRAAVAINPTFEKAQKNLRLLENDGRGFLILLRSILK